MFLIKVSENIGTDSISTFGPVGTIFEVSTGKFTDMEGDEWTNDGYGYESLEDVNKHFGINDTYQTVFELVE